jgi:hypothetical protein
VFILGRLALFILMCHTFRTASNNFFYSKLTSSFLLCSSFNDKPVDEGTEGPIGRDLFEKEQDDLLADLIDIPKKACDRRVC